MNNKIPFYKMSGSGNDFIMIDNRQGVVADEVLEHLIVGACRRRMSAGADGLILIEESNRADFRWRFYNADGSRAEMCGNGARCAARFANLLGIADAKMSFETDVGRISAEIIGERVKIGMTEPGGLVLDQRLNLGDTAFDYDFINTGVPHVVIASDELEEVDVFHAGRLIRNHESFAPAGTNVNFVQQLDRQSIAVRTYERGVENETLACGTGCVAASLVTGLKNGWESPVDVRTRSGGILRIYFNRRDEIFSDVYLEGDARIIYDGMLWEEAWET
jgi:diaminopimelate epimerase